MPYPSGGRADKYGNAYERNYIIYQILNILRDEIISIKKEPEGDDEKSTDLILHFNDYDMFLQCKGRNGSNEVWEWYNVKDLGLFSAWKEHLDRNPINHVGLVSPIKCSIIYDLVHLCRNTSDYDNFEKNHLDIHSCGQKMKNCYDAFAKCFNIDKNSDAKRLIEYIKRIDIITISEDEISEWIKLLSQQLFVEDYITVQSKIMYLLENMDTNGINIDSTLVLDFLSKNDINLLNLSNDKTNASSILKINSEYEIGYKKIKDSIIKRSETNLLFNKIAKEENIVVCGNAGYGKSGVIMDLISNLNDNNIPYLTINLETYPPYEEPDAYGKRIGLKASPCVSLDALSKNRNCVIIFDQLDSLKWTNPKSKECIAYLRQILSELELINIRREHKISTIFVVRTYDYDNDANINGLFKKEYQKINIGTLSSHDILSVLGEKEYRLLNRDLVKLLSIPNNLYIYMQIKEKRKDYTTSSSLISSWLKEIYEGNPKYDLRATINEISNGMLIENKNYCLKSKINYKDADIAILKSNNIITEKTSNSISFFHQSIYDYMISNTLVDCFYKEKNAIKVIGNQIPENRYRVQLALQTILENDINDFIKIAKSFICNKNILGYYKILIPEIISLVENPDDSLVDFVISYFKFPYMNRCLLMNRNITIAVLKKIDLSSISGLDLKKYLNDLVSSFSESIDGELLNILLKYKDFDDKLEITIFNHLNRDFCIDDSVVFDFRISMLEKGDSLLSSKYYNINNSFNKDDLRTFEILKIYIEKNIAKENNFHDHFNDGINLDRINLVHPREILDSLIIYLPDKCKRYSPWSNHSFKRINTNRFVVELIKKCLYTISIINSAYYVDYILNKFEVKSLVHREIFIYGVSLIKDAKYANSIIQRITSNIELFLDETSGLNHTEYLRIIIKNNICLADAEVISLFFDKLYRYIPRFNIENYKYVKSYFHTIYGELQYVILNELEDSLLDNKMLRLKKELIRKYGKDRVFFAPNDCSGGSVISPVNGKKLSFKSWIEIIENKKNFSENNTLGKMKNGYLIESSPRELSCDFENTINLYFDEYLDYFLNTKVDIHTDYIDSFFYSISKMGVISNRKVLIKLLLKYLDLNNLNRTQYFLAIIKNNIEYFNDSKILFLIYKKYHERIKDFNEALTYDSFYLNSVWGEFAQVVAKFIQHYNIFDESIKYICNLYVNNKNNNIRYCSIYMLVSAMNFDKKYVEDTLIDLYKKDINMFSYYYTYRLFPYLYGYKNISINELLLLALNSENKSVKTQAAFLMTETYLNTGLYKRLLSSCSDNNIIPDVMNVVFEYLKENPTKIEIKRAFFIIGSHLDDYGSMSYLLRRLLRKDSLSLLKNENKKLLKYISKIKDIRGLINELDDIKFDNYEVLYKICLTLEKKINNTDFYLKGMYSNIVFKLYELYKNDKKRCKKILSIINKLYIDGSGKITLYEYSKL